MPTAPNVTIIPAKVQTAENRSKYHQLRVAAYCRVSTAQEEQQNSYQVQIAYYTDLINRKKEWTLAGIFADEGISGTQTKKRTEFNRMIRMCRNQKIDLVITKSISRFARNTVDCLEYVRQLKDLGIGVIFEKENINTSTMTSEFMIALYGSFAQAESESISKNVSWGKEKAYCEGKVQFQYKYLLGYKKGEDGKPEIVPEEAETVRLIYTLFLDGYSMSRIKKLLENKGILTSQGKKVWNESLIRSILKNEKYAGDALLQKTFTSDCITHKIVKNHGERPMYLVTDHHDPIIDRDTYNRVQQELARRSSKRKVSDKTITEQGKYSSKYALTELLICGKCGTPYRRTTWTSRGKKLIVWRCISRLEHGRRYCPDSPTIKEEQLHKAIVRAINNYYSCGNDVEKILKANIGNVLECHGQEEIAAIEKRLKEIDKARSDLISLIATGDCDEDKLDSEFEKLYEEEQSLSERLAMLKSKNQTSAETQAKLDKIIDMIEHEKFELETFDNVLIRKLIECVKVLSKTEIPVIVMKGAFGMDANTFPIRIDQQGADGTYTKHTSFVSYSAMIDSGMPLVLPVGDYQVVASSYDQAAAEGRVSETPYFEGKQDFVIEEKTVTSVPSFTCTFESVGVEVRLSDQFKAKLEAEPLNYSYSVTVYDGEVSWTFDPDKHTKPAYYLDPCENLVLKVTVKLDGLTYPERTCMQPEYR